MISVTSTSSSSSSPSTSTAASSSSSPSSLGLAAFAKVLPLSSVFLAGPPMILSFSLPTPPLALLCSSSLWEEPSDAQAMPMACLRPPASAPSAAESYFSSGSRATKASLGTSVLSLAAATTCVEEWDRLSCFRAAAKPRSRASSSAVRRLASNAARIRHSSFACLSCATLSQACSPLLATSAWGSWVTCWRLANHLGLATPASEADVPLEWHGVRTSTPPVAGQRGDLHLFGGGGGVDAFARQAAEGCVTRGT
mmetsp:Transcript_111898/g.316183  ORF Transcript_111898/g.316183 Transcript_111898/m.316183 type:complete len:254 (+) Transcript_111898:280-1041(+)